MQFLVDTNIGLELLLNQQQAQEVRQLFEEREGSDFAITEFSLYSIGIVLTRLSKDEAFAQFIADALEQAGTRGNRHRRQVAENRDRLQETGMGLSV